MASSGVSAKSGRAHCFSAPRDHRRGDLGATTRSKKKTIRYGLNSCLPIASLVNFVQVFPTLFAKVFVGGALLCHDSDTGSVLPYLADIALHIEARYVVCDIESSQYYGVWGVSRLFGFGVKGWRARVVVEPANAADGLVILLNIIASVGHFYRVLSR